MFKHLAIAPDELQSGQFVFTTEMQIAKNYITKYNLHGNAQGVEDTVLIFTVMVLCDFHGPEALCELQGLKDQTQCISWLDVIEGN